MATVFTNRLARQGRIFATVLISLWVIMIGFVSFRYWLFMDEDMLTASPEHLILFDDIFFMVSAIIIVMLGVIGYIVSRLYTMLIESSEQVAHEHEVALKHEQEQIRIKRQLTNNINHELKTPICSILGYLEMVINNDKLDKKTTLSFVQKSYEQAERLRRLMLDLSTITRIDEAAEMVKRESVDVGGVILSIIDDTMPQAESQKIEIVTNVNSQLMIEGNNSLVYSIFRNLIDNAIAYSGGRTAKIDLVSDEPDLYRFRISDNGIGIEDKHFPYIFERFYRVDAGRSRKLGGTGLGLSIVKNAVLFHGGNITAHKSAMGGAEFGFTLRKKLPEIAEKLGSEE